MSKQKTKEKNHLTEEKSPYNDQGPRADGEGRALNENGEHRGDRKARRGEEEPLPDMEEPPKLNAEDIDESRQEIEVAAYYLGLERNQYAHPGDPLSDWLRAEKEAKKDLD